MAYMKKEVEEEDENSTVDFVGALSSNEQAWNSGLFQTTAAFWLLMMHKALFYDTKAVLDP